MVTVLLFTVLCIGTVQAQLGGLRIGQGVEEALAAIVGGEYMTSYSSGHLIVIQLKGGEFLGQLLSPGSLNFYNGELYCAFLTFGDAHRTELVPPGWFDSTMREQFGEPMDEVEEFAVLDSLSRAMSAVRHLPWPRRFRHDERWWRVRDGAETVYIRLGTTGRNDDWVYLEFNSIPRRLARYGQYDDPRYGLPMIERLCGPLPGAPGEEVEEWMEAIGFTCSGAEDMTGYDMEIDPAEIYRASVDGTDPLLPSTYRVWYDEEGMVSMTAATISDAPRAGLPDIQVMFEWMPVRTQEGTVTGMKYAPAPAGVMEEVWRILPRLAPPEDPGPFPNDVVRTGVWRVPGRTHEYVLLTYGEEHERTFWRFNTERLQQTDESCSFLGIF